MPETPMRGRREVDEMRELTRVHAQARFTHLLKRVRCRFQKRPERSIIYKHELVDVMPESSICPLLVYARPLRCRPLMPQICLRWTSGNIYITRRPCAICPCLT